MGYVYRGTGADTITGRSGGRPRLPEEHGSRRGYQQHHNWGTLPPCQPCLDANAEYHRQLKDNQPVARPADFG